MFDAGKQTVGEYLERWLEECVKGTVRESTFDRYKYAIGPHIKPALGRMKLKSLTPAHVRGFYREKLDCRARTGYGAQDARGLAQGPGSSRGRRPNSAQRADALKLPRIDREEITPLTVKRQIA